MSKEKDYEAVKQLSMAREMIKQAKSNKQKSSKDKLKNKGS